MMKAVADACRSATLAAPRHGRQRLARWAARFAARVALGACLVGLGACAALSPDDPAALAQSERLVEQQDARAARLADGAHGRRVWLAGFAMGSTSTAFQGDLELLTSRLGALGGPLIAYAHSNRPALRALRYPFADLRTIRESLQHIAERAAPDDIVVVLASSHGIPNVLSVNVAAKERVGVSDLQLAEAMAPLGHRPTLVILSACYSGSFIPALRGDARVVLTSASAQRTSFGCDTSGRNTIFVEELLGRDFDAQLSLRQLVVRAKAQVARREDSLRLPHSDPQLSVGPKAMWLFDRPLQHWFDRDLR